MPDGAHFVWAPEGKLREEVIFDPKSVDRVPKVLIGQATLADRVTLCFGPKEMTLTCGSARILTPTKQTGKKQP